MYFRGIKIAHLVVALAGAVGVGALLAWQPVWGSVLLCAVLLIAGVLQQPAMLLYGAIALIALGQIGRFQPLSGGSPLLMDALLGLLMLVWIVFMLWRRATPVRSLAHSIWGAFLLIALISLLGSPLALNRAELLDALLYWVRLVFYTSVLWSIPSFITTTRGLDNLHRIFLWSGAGVLGLGLLQLVFIPDIGFLGTYGWDPHVGRFVSTFLDPNYLGGYLALLLSCIFAVLMVRPSAKWYWVFAGCTLIAGMLTFSRSGYLALACVLLLAVFRYSWKLLLLSLLCIVPLALAIPRVRDRVIGGFQVDVTAQDRLKSWDDALHIIAKRPLLGVGYNAYEAAQLEVGVLSPSVKSHANTGSDSSLLNVVATTGIVGGVLYLLAMLLFYQRAQGLVRTKRGSSSQRIAAYTVLFAIPALFVHSLFVNSLFYPLILLPLVVFLATLYIGEQESLPEP
jgi:O-antigen ligase